MSCGCNQPDPTLPRAIYQGEAYRVIQVTRNGTRRLWAWSNLKTPRTTLKVIAAVGLARNVVCSLSLMRLKMSKHTPEPWSDETHPRTHTISDNSGTYGIARSMSDSDFAIACSAVNALAGIDNPSDFVRAARELADKAEQYQDDDTYDNEKQLREALSAFRAAGGGELEEKREGKE